MAFEIQVYIAVLGHDDDGTTTIAKAERNELASLWHVTDVPQAFDQLRQAMVIQAEQTVAVATSQILAQQKLAEEQG